MIGRLVTAVFTGFPARRIIMMVALTLVWCVLWGTLSVANLVSGALIALPITATGLGRALPGGVRPGPLAHLVWLVLLDLLRSMFKVVREILTPNNHTSESIVAVTVPPEARRHMLLFTVAITLTPGTVVVDTDVETGTLYIHLLHDTDVAATAAHVQRLAQLAGLAFPVNDSAVAQTPAGDQP